MDDLDKEIQRLLGSRRERVMPLPTTPARVYDQIHRPQVVDEVLEVLPEDLKAKLNGRQCDTFRLELTNLLGQGYTKEELSQMDIHCVRKKNGKVVKGRLDRIIK